MPTIRCAQCRKVIEVENGSKRRFCPKCVSERQGRGGRKRKGLSQLHNKTIELRTCLHCRQLFQIKVDSRRRFCEKCLQMKRRMAALQRWDEVYEKKAAERKKKRIAAVQATKDMPMMDIWRENNPEHNVEREPDKNERDCSNCFWYSYNELRCTMIAPERKKEACIEAEPGKLVYAMWLWEHSEQAKMLGDG